MRIGVGYDVHTFAAARPLILGGVRISEGDGLAGHSDADALIHAIIDALLGAAALGDIGHHFPPGDPVYKDISSAVLLERTQAMLKDAGYRVVNVDATVVAERPRLAPYIDEMRQNIARSLAVTPDQVSVKATTHEGIGAVGRGEGIAVLAVALLGSLES